MGTAVSLTLAWEGRQARKETAALLIQASHARSWHSTAPAETRAEMFPPEESQSSCLRLKGSHRQALGLWCRLFIYWGLGGQSWLQRRHADDQSDLALHL